MPGAFAYQLNNGNAFINVARCETTTLGGNEEWTTNSGFTLEQDDFTGIRREGANLVEVSQAVATNFLRRQLSAGGGTSPVDMTKNDVHGWFLYSAKTGELLADPADSCQIVMHSGGTAGTAFGRWYLAGANADGFFPTLIKSWNALHVSGENPSLVSGSPDFTAVTFIDFQLTNQASNTSDQQPDFAVDYFKIGNKIQITAGTVADPVRPIDLIDWDALGSNPTTDPDEGLLVAADVFIRLRAGLDFGDGTTTTVWVAENFVFFADQFSSICNHDFRVENGATATFGTKIVGSQATYAINGCILVAPEVYRDGTFDRNTSLLVEDSTSGAFRAYGTKIFRLKDVQFGVSTGANEVELIDCDFDSNVNIELNTAVTAVNTKFHDPFPTELTAGAAFIDDNGTFTAVTTNWNAQAGVFNLFPTSEVVGQDGHVFGFSEKFGSVRFDLQTDGAGGAFTPQYWDGTQWAALTIEEDTTNDLTQSGRISWQAPDDWATRNINATGDFYYVRLEVATLYLTNPVGQQGFIGQKRLGSLTVAPTELSGCSFFRCDRALKFDANATVTGYIATDNAYDVVLEDLVTATLVDSQFLPSKLLQV